MGVSHTHLANYKTITTLSVYSAINQSTLGSGRIVIHQKRILTTFC